MLNCFLKEKKCIHQEQFLTTMGSTQKEAWKWNIYIFVFVWLNNWWNVRCAIPKNNQWGIKLVRQSHHLYKQGNEGHFDEAIWDSTFHFPAKFQAVLLLLKLLYSQFMTSKKKLACKRWFVARYIICWSLVVVLTVLSVFKRGKWSTFRRYSSGFSSNCSW